MLPHLHRRLAAEWELLLQLQAVNPGRISHLQEDGPRFRLRLRGPSAVPAEQSARAFPLTEHAITIEFPVHFPAVPMEMFLDTPVFHPNVHPETGFVCLWDTHRVNNTAEHALHKLCAMLCGDLRNTEGIHVMQPAAAENPVRTASMPLLGVAHEAVIHSPAPRRRRLQ